MTDSSSPTAEGVNLRSIRLVKFPCRWVHYPEDGGGVGESVVWINPAEISSVGVSCGEATIHLRSGRHYTHCVLEKNREWNHAGEDADVFAWRWLEEWLISAGVQVPT